MLEELSTTIGAAEQQPGRVEFKAEIDYPALLRAQSARDAEPSSCVALCPGIEPLLSADPSPSALRRRESEIDDSDDSDASRQEAEDGQGEELEEPEPEVVIGDDGAPIIVSTESSGAPKPPAPPEAAGSVTASSSTSSSSSSDSDAELGFRHRCAPTSPRCDASFADPATSRFDTQYWAH